MRKIEEGMEQVLGTIRLAYSDPEINQLLKSPVEAKENFTRHFNQSEEFFIKLPQEFTVPSFPIHHDVHKREPDKQYLQSLAGLIKELHSMVPSVFAGLTYMFDPAESLRPAFFQIYRVSGETYLYLMRLDLIFKPQKHDVLEKGTNDRAPVYRTNELLIEADVIPLLGVHHEEGKVTGFEVKQLISDTWIGETGRGYFVQGIWLDTELTKFFSKLFVPKGKRMYPYYPYTSKFRTITYDVIGLTSESRRKAVPTLHRVRKFLTPYLDEIQELLKEKEFSEELSRFQEIRNLVPVEWIALWKTFKLDVYLNDREMKEYEVVGTVL